MKNYSDIIAAVQNVEQSKPVFISQFKNLCYMTPNKAFVSKHPFIKKKVEGKFVPAEYMPIDKVEFLLDFLFEGNYKVEVLKTEMADDRFHAVVRVHYFHPETKEWMFHDGASVKLVQQESDNEEKELMNQLKQHAHSNPNLLDRAKYLRAYYDLQKAKPVRREAWEAVAQIAISEAIKDAADHLGPLLGRDLNRKDPIEFTSQTSAAPVTYTPKENNNTLIDL